MTIRHMMIFLAVYRTGSITRAAEQLFMTQPAVSRAIQEMEKYYGVPLFERIHQRLSVTEAGKKFYHYALHIVDSFEQMEMEFRNWDELGILRVGATLTVGSMLLPKVLKEFQKMHPGITVRATVNDGSTLEMALENNELDLALVEGEVLEDNLIAEMFSRDRLMLLLPTDSELLDRDELRLTDLAGYPHILREQHSISRRMVDHAYASRHITIDPFIESSSTHVIVQAVHEGLGISFLSDRLVRHSVESGFIASRKLEDEGFVRNNYIVRHKNKLLTESAKDFMNLCRQHASMLDQ